MTIEKHPGDKGAERRHEDLGDYLLGLAVELERGATRGACGNVVATQRHLAEAVAALALHRASEEGPGCFYDSLHECLPHRRRKLDQLRREHASIGTWLESLSARLGPATRGVDASALALEARRMAGRVERHDAVEVDLLYEMVLDDDLNRGGGD